MSNSSLQSFVDFIAIRFPLSQDEKEHLLSKVTVLDFRKEDIVINAASTAHTLFFITKGIVRSYYQKDIREINTEFFFEQDFMTAFTSFLTDEPTKLCFQCLEDCKVVSIPKILIHQLLNQDNKWQILINDILKKEYIKKCRRESSFLLFDANERYHYFLEQFSESENRIPLFHVASYLGISPETLSRIRSKKINQIDLSQVDKI